MVMLIPSIIISRTIFAGYFFKDIFIGHHSNEFWQSSIFSKGNRTLFYTPVVLVITPLLVVISIPITFYYFISNTTFVKSFKNTNLPLYNFLLNKWYIDELYEIIFVTPAKNWFIF